jgi:6-pyruvoyltetrahydropterin/6-carboxytetrahydropterin synthase
MTFKSTKTYGANIGLSACFRQWKAESHCKLLHGYALEISFEFETEELDIRNWCVDFGSMKSLKAMLENTFDHTLLVAVDDPHLETLLLLGKLGIARVVVVQATGCEKFAELIYECAEQWLKDNGYAPRCKLAKVEVREHAGNSAIYTRTAV